jgi:CheY-like chemotaxis protein
LKKILIVDNSIVIRNILKNSFLDNQEVIIFEADSLKEVCKLVLEHKFFIVISNLVLPDSANFELLRLFKKENIPTIIFSSNLEADLLDTEYSNIINHVIKNANGFKFIYKLVSAMIYCNNEEILLIDDSITHTNYMKGILEKLLIKVSIARNGIEALEILEENNFIDIKRL